jgi:polynucleotide 5'-kinase involved in rRNA processing
MVKSILLKFDEEFFYKLKADKQRRERAELRTYTWEEYIKELFDMK